MIRIFFLFHRLQNIKSWPNTKSIFSWKKDGCTPNFQGICIFRRGTRIKRENLKKINSDEDNRLFVNFLNDTKNTFWVYLKPIYTTFRNNFSAQSVDHHLKLQNQKSFEKFIWYLGKKSILRIEKKNSSQLELENLTRVKWDSDTSQKK